MKREELFDAFSYIDEQHLHRAENAEKNKRRPKYKSFIAMAATLCIIVTGAFALFKAKDSNISPKLQFLPASFVDELMNSHFGNRLFEIDEKFTTTLYLEKGEQNNSFKNKWTH